ncbi:MAG: regulatory protein GemA [Syntrophorhabdus sp.]|nr:regulatory protein GemA [Syntrophorhabdus sp.]
MNEAVNRKQLQIIHVALKQLRLDDATYRAMLKNRYKVESSKNLSYREASELIDCFKGLGFRLKTKRTPPQNPCWPCAPRTPGVPLPENVVVLASPGQLRMIEHLAADIKWRHWDGYRRWLKKYFKIDQVRTSPDASAVIEALKNMWKDQNGCACRRVGNQG